MTLAELASEARLSVAKVRAKNAADAEMRRLQKEQAAALWVAGFMEDKLPGHLRDLIATGAVSIRLSPGRGEVPDDLYVLEALANRLQSLLGINSRIVKELDYGAPDGERFERWQFYIEF